MSPVFSSMVKMEVAPSPESTYFTFPSPLSTSEWSWGGRRGESENWRKGGRDELVDGGRVGWKGMMVDGWMSWLVDGRWIDGGMDKLMDDGWKR